jgi:uncharacterized protein (TIGR02594 family)
MASFEPRWLTIARGDLGTRETPGPASNSKIMAWARKLGSRLGITYADDSVPWCGLFVGRVMLEAGFTPPQIAVRASSWDAWGVPVSKVYLGAVARFQRPGGGHVAIIVGQDADHLQVIGGNQSDAVTITWIAKSRCVAMRWPEGNVKPTILAPMVKRSGTVSRNEA